MVRPVMFHPKARDAVRRFPKEARVRLGKDLFRLQMGEQIAMPVARPMPVVSAGVSELRVKCEDGIFRVLLPGTSEGVLVFHAFVKKAPAGASP